MKTKILCALIAVSALSSFGDYAKYVEMTVGYSGSSVSDFPALVRLDSSRINYADVKNAGADIQFTDETGSTVYPHEVDTWNPSGESLVWVRLPQLATGAKFRMYYGDETVTANTSATDVWTGYDLVCHVSGNANDSTANARHGQLNPGGTTKSNGIIGQTHGMAAIDSGAAVIHPLYNWESNQGEVLEDGQFSYSLWFRANAEFVAWKNLAGPRNSADADAWGVRSYNPTSKLGVRTAKNSELVVATSGFAVGDWHKIDVTMNGTALAVYLDGDSLGSSTLSIAPKRCWVQSMAWGGTCGSGTFGTTESLAVDVDECRVFSTVADAARVAADYATVTDAAFLTYAAPCDVSGGTSCTHESTFTNGVLAATCTTAGIAGDVYCNDCGALIETGSEIPALGHLWGDWTVTQEPTTSSTGTKHRECLRDGCDAEETEAIPMLSAVVALRNIAVATAVGTVPTLPAKVAGLKADGTVDGEFDVVWESTAAPSTAGLTFVNGTATMNGAPMGVTASIRAALASSGGGSGELINIAPLASSMTVTPIPAKNPEAQNQSVITNGWAGSDMAFGQWKTPAHSSHRYFWAADQGTIQVDFAWPTTQRISAVGIAVYDGNQHGTSALKYSSTGSAIESDKYVYEHNGNNYYKINQGDAHYYVFKEPIALSELTVEVTKLSSSTWIGLYQIEIFAEDAGSGGTVEPLSTDTLSALAVDGTAVADFAPTTYSYTVDNGAAITSATSDDNVGITILPKADGAAYVVTLAEDGESTQKYTVSMPVVIACTHEHTSVTGAVAATCTTAGYTGDTVCEDCETVLETGSEIPALGHLWGDWTVTQEATTTSTGSQRRECLCEGCDAEETETIPVLASVVALRNVAVATAVGTVPTLPAKVVGLMADGTVSGEYDVVWNAVAAPSAEGVTLVNGTATVNGAQMGVTASVRAAVASSGGGELVNIAPLASSMTVTPIPAKNAEAQNQSVITNGWAGSDMAYGQWKTPAHSSHRYFWTAADQGTIKVDFAWSTTQRISAVGIAVYDGNQHGTSALKYASTGSAIESDKYVYEHNGNNYYKINSGDAHYYAFKEPISLSELTVEVTKLSTGTWIGLYQIEIFAESAGSEGGSVEPLSTDTLSALAVDGTAVAGFAPTTYSYTVDNGAAITSATSDDNVGITVLPKFNGSAYVVTLAEDGESTKTYTVAMPVVEIPPEDPTGTGFQKSIDITVSGYTGEVVDDFPILVRLDSSKINYADVRHGGADLAFTDRQNTQSYPYEVDTWNPDGVSYVWVKLPKLYPNAKFRMWYGDPDKTANTTAAAVWSDYSFVCHMGSAEDSARDATTVFIAGSAVDGIVGGARGTASAGLGPVLANVLSPTVPETFTVSGWMRLNDLATLWGSLFSSGVPNADTWKAAFPVDHADALWVYSRKADTYTAQYMKNDMFTTDEWTKFDAVFTESSIELFLNGKSREPFVTPDAPIQSWGNTLFWGGCGAQLATFETDNSLGANFDECRIRAAEASPARLAADYWTVREATALDFTAPVEKGQEFIPSEPDAPRVKKEGTVIYLLGAQSLPVDEGAWRIQVMDPTHVVFQYDGYEPFERVYKETGDVVAAEAEIARTYDLLDGCTFEVDGTTVSQVGRSISTRGQLSYKGANDHNELVGGTSHFGWTIRPVYHLFVEFGTALVEGATNTVVLPDGSTKTFVYQAATPSPLFKVNQVGYAASAKKKYVYLGGWLGTAGAFPLNDSYPCEVVNAATDAVVLTGSFAKRMDDQYHWDPNISTEPLPLTGEKTLEADISALTEPGTYYVRVAGVGRSMDFRVADEAVADQFAVHMLGLYQQRCGCAKEEPYTHWTDDACHLQVYRGVQPANDDEYAKCFEHNGVNPSPSHFTIIEANAPHCTEKLSLPGGWHDAADYDRRPYHLQIVMELANVYLMRPDNFFDGQLAMPQNHNNIPDVLDEADWGLQHLLAAQQADGGVGTWIETTTHPDYSNKLMPSGDTDRFRYYLARATHRSTLKYCAAAANLARALKAAGTPEALARAAVYQASAERAWTFVTTTPRQVAVPLDAGSMTVYYTEPAWLDPFEYVKAVVNLGVLTGDATYFDHLNDTLLYNQGGADNYSYGTRNFQVFDYFSKRQEANNCITEAESLGRSGFILSELGVPFNDSGLSPAAKTAYATILEGWTYAVTKRAETILDQMENGMPYRMPYWGGHGSDTAIFDQKLDWGQSNPLRRSLWLSSAHFLTGEEKYLTAAHLACDYQTGCNPIGSTWTTGLGKIYPVAILSLQSFADKYDEYIPGLTPYHNSARWQFLFDHAGAFGTPEGGGEPAYLTETVYKPIWRRWEVGENMNISVSEYTVTETIGPCAAAVGYLMTPGKATANLKRPRPAKRLADLPGYWALP